MRLFTRKESSPQPIHPQWLVALGFLIAILVGTDLLMLPVAAGNGKGLPFVTALFTATSATCVTGLSVIDIGTELTRFGQLVVLTLIQLGGLGITTFGTFLLVLVGRRLSVQNEFVLMDAYGVGKVTGIRSLLIWTMGFTVLFEGIGTLILWTRYLTPMAGRFAPPDFWTALYYAAFHAVSAFCNAGFSLHADSLTAFQNDALFVGTVELLIVFGGIGFLVTYNLVTIKFWRRNLMTRGRISLHAKIALYTTLILIVAGTVLFLAQEWSNTLGHLSPLSKISCALFQSITPRTAGFNIVPMDQIKGVTRLTTSLLMLIGGCPGSAAGGMKVTTLAVLVMTAIAMCKGRQETVLFSRTIPNAVVRESIVIFLLAVMLILTAYGLLLCTEHPLKDDGSAKLLFETVSAVATSGLSINQTTSLSTVGRWIIIACMYVGRLGPLTIALMIGNRDEKLRIRYPEEEIVVG